MSCYSGGCRGLLDMTRPGKRKRGVSEAECINFLCSFRLFLPDCKQSVGPFVGPEDSVALVLALPSIGSSR
jgi:hypothetical protein